MSTYSNLKIQLIGTGELPGTWGTATNVNWGSTGGGIEQAVVGMATISSGFTGTPLELTLTLTDTAEAQNARALVLNLTQSLGSAGTLNVPAIQKPYMVINSTGQTVTVKVSGQTGVDVPTGTRTFLYNNGTDVGVFFNYAPSLSLGSLAITTPLPITSGGTGTSSTTFVNLASNVTGQLPIANGGTASSTASGARTALAVPGLADANSYSNTNNFQDNEVIRPKVKDYSMTVNALGNISGATTVNLELGNYVTATCTNNVTWTFSNPAASGSACGFILVLTNGGAYTQTWPASVDWPFGGAPTLTSSGTDVLVFITNDGGTIWRGNISMQDSK